LMDKPDGTIAQEYGLESSLRRDSKRAVALKNERVYLKI